MKLVEYPDREMMMLALAEHASPGELARFPAPRWPRHACRVPGGTTPGPIFDTLSGVDLDWANVAVLLNDERWVPEDSPPVQHPPAARTPAARAGRRRPRLVPLYAPARRSPKRRWRRWPTALRPHLPISVLLLGMGADMHTASLFPGADRLDEALSADAPLLLPMRAEAAGEPRITLTAPVLRGAMSTSTS